VALSPQANYTDWATATYSIIINKYKIRRVTDLGTSSWIRTFCHVSPAVGDVELGGLCSTTRITGHVYSCWLNQPLLKGPDLARTVTSRVQQHSYIYRPSTVRGRIIRGIFWTLLITASVLPYSDLQHPASHFSIQHLLFHHSSWQSCFIVSETYLSLFCEP
jgi:hypothetical protein